MKIHVLGAYLPHLDQQGIANFIASDILQYREFWRNRISQAKSSWSIDEMEERAKELADELNTDLQTCAIFEVEVTGNTQTFHASDFFNPISGNCGWEPAYLTVDGQLRITDNDYVSPTTEHFRVVFYIHKWGESGFLQSPTGELKLPQFSIVPPRLWQLAPYVCMD